MTDSIFRTGSLAQRAIRAAVVTSVSLAVFLLSACETNTPSSQNNTLSGPLAKKGGLSNSASVNMPTVSLGAASTFAVLGGTGDVTLTGSTVTGNVGHYPGTSNVIMTSSVVYGTVNANAELAHNNFIVAYDAIAALPCDAVLTGTLANVTLLPGVYCFDAAATLTGVLTLDGQNNPNALWIFKIGTSGTGALTGTGFSVVMADGGSPCNNVFWWVSQAATMTTSNFQGTILAGAAVTITGGTFNGDILAKADVTLTDAVVLGCGSGPVQPPIYGYAKVTGGGEISVGSGSATFGFNAQPNESGGAKGEFNYVNHATGLHVNGKVDNIVVIEINTDNSPKTVLFSGTYDGGTFIVTVQDNGEPGVNDQFGVTLSGSQPEVTSMRTISKGNIQFHK
jgi:hypothetical protein